MKRQPRWYWNRVLSKRHWSRWSDKSWPEASALRRDEETLQALEYYNRLPHTVDLQVCYAVDPMLATGGSAIDAINVLKRRGIPRLSYVGIIAAPFGLLKLAQTHPDIDIYIGALDDSLNDRGYILP